MKKYIVRIRTEELKGRIDKIHEIRCSTYEDSESILEDYLENLFRTEEVENYANIHDDKWVVEYFPKMRETIEIVEA